MSDLREWLTLCAGSVAFIVSLIQYRRAQKWKRMEWMAEQVDTFLQDPHVKNGLRILDWKERVLPMLLDAPEPATGKTFSYTEAMLDHALRSSSRKQERDYTDEELVIRDCMDRLLDGFDRFEVFIQQDLIKAEELYSFLGYWIDVLGDPRNARKSAAARQWIDGYIRDYSFGNVPKLLSRFEGKWVKA